MYYVAAYSRLMDYNMVFHVYSCTSAHYMYMCREYPSIPHIIYETATVVPNRTRSHWYVVMVLCAFYDVYRNVGRVYCFLCVCVSACRVCI